MHKILIIGDLKEILPFRAFNFDILPIDEMRKSKKEEEILKEIFEKNEYKIIFIVEKYYEKYVEFYNSLKSLTNLVRAQRPIIVSITSGVDFRNLGFKHTKLLIKKALGMDILV